MKSMLKTLRLQTKILLSLAPILFILGLFVFEKLRSDVNVFFSMSQIQNIVNSTCHLGDLMHEFQKERAMSALYIGSKGENKAGLASQREKTDQMYKAASSIFEKHSMEGVTTDVEQNMENAHKLIKNIFEKRAQIDALKLTSNENFMLFTQTCMSISDTIFCLIKMSKDPAFTHKMLGYARYIQMKEFAGQERANGTAALSMGKFEGALLEKFFTLESNQIFGKNIFKEISDEDTREFEKTTMAQEKNSVESLRQKIKEQFQNPGIVAADWVKATTDRINLMKVVEDYQAKKLDDLSHNFASNSKKQIVIFMTLIFALIVLCSYIINYIIKYVSRPIVRYSHMMTDIAAHNFDVVIEPSNRLDEIGQMEESLIKLKEITEKSVTLESALNQVGSNVLLISLQGEIIYMNNAAQNLFQSLQKPQVQGLMLNDVCSNVVSAFETLKRDGFLHFEFGAHTLNVHSNIVKNRHEQIMGYVTQWTDLTQELSMQKDIQSLVSGVLEGDLTVRIREDNKTGFMADLSKNMNQITSTIQKVLSEVGLLLSNLSDGHLNYKMKSDFRGIFFELKENANQSVDQLSSTMQQLKTVTGELVQISGHLIHSSNDLSQRTERQAAELEQTAASMEEVTSTVHQNTDSSKRASIEATEASQAANTGGQMVHDVVSAMGEISSSSQRISEIIVMIDEIAFQTNLLALNAAVEAARAGEAGKGFAVVADEVRALAQRSAQASKEIKTLISESAGQVQTGVKLVNQTGDILNKIVGMSSHVATVVSDIAMASTEQVVGLDQINQAVSTLDDMTQKNAHIVTQTTSAARELDAQARKLRDLVDFFKFDGASYT